MKRSTSVYLQFQPDPYIYKPWMDDRDGIADQWRQHAQLSWHEPKEIF